MGQLRLCTVDGCSKKHKGRGLCAMHTERIKRLGSLDLPLRKPGWLAGKQGAEVPAWKGMEASYTPKHKWLDRHYGHLKKECSRCGATNCRIEWANISGKYLREIEDYMPLCVSCHRRMDLHKTHCPQGHELSGYNLKIAQGSRHCRQCDVTRTREYRAKIKALNIFPD